MPPRRETRHTAQRLLEAFGPTAFSATAGRAAGLSARQLEQAVRSETIVRLRQGLYAVSDDDAEVHLGVLQATADRLRVRGTEPIVIGRSAARLRRDVERDLGSRDPRRVARALVAGDIVVTKAAVMAQILDEAGHRGGRRLQSLIVLAHAAPENAFEALSWAAIAQSDLPRPLCQQWAQGASGRWYRVDYLWPEWGLIGEADGAVKYASGADVLAEKRRQADLEAAGYRFVRWIWEDVVPDATPMLCRVGRAIKERGGDAPNSAAYRQLRAR